MRHLLNEVFILILLVHVEYVQVTIHTVLERLFLVASIAIAFHRARLVSQLHRLFDHFGVWDRNNIKLQNIILNDAQELGVG